MNLEIKAPSDYLSTWLYFLFEDSAGEEGKRKLLYQTNYDPHLDHEELPMG